MRKRKFCDRLRAIRKATGLSNSEMAVICEVFPRTFERWVQTEPVTPTIPTQVEVLRRLDPESFKPAGFSVTQFEDGKWGWIGTIGLAGDLGSKTKFQRRVDAIANAVVVLKRKGLVPSYKR